MSLIPSPELKQLAKQIWEEFREELIAEFGDNEKALALAEVLALRKLAGGDAKSRVGLGNKKSPLRPFTR